MSLVKQLALLDIINSKLPHYKNIPFYNEFIEVISNSDRYNLIIDLGLSRYYVDKELKKLNKPTTIRWCTHILNTGNVKYCTKCDSVKEFVEFPLNASRAGGYNVLCKICHYNANKDKQVARTAKYKSIKLNRVPKWANLKYISEIYAKCPTDMQVDHIIPLQGDLVSGLHVENNLQYLSVEDNLIKHNKFLIAE